MEDSANMSTPVTRGELKEELALFRLELKQELAAYATKADLKQALAAYPTKAELKQELALFRQELKQELKHELRQDLEIWGGALLARIELSEQRLLAELARHTKAAFESMSGQIAGSTRSTQTSPDA